jgi:hypothetical protein
VKTLDGFPILGLKGEVMTTCKLNLSRRALGRRYDKLVCPEEV